MIKTKPCSTCKYRRPNPHIHACWEPRNLVEGKPVMIIQIFRMRICEGRRWAPNNKLAGTLKRWIHTITNIIPR